MTRRMSNLLLTLLALVLLLGFAAAVPSGRLTDEADERYHDQQRKNDEENDWLWNLGAPAGGEEE